MSAFVKPSKPHVLTADQKRLVQAYDGSVKKSAAAAKISASTASKWINEPWFKAEVEKREAKIEAEAVKNGLKSLAGEEIATVAQAKAYWTKVMLDDEESTAMRLKASEMLAKAGGVFIEKREVTSENKTTIVVDERDVGERIAQLRGLASEN